MKSDDKTREQLINKIEKSNAKITKLEKPEIAHEKAEKALKESEEKFRILYKSSRDAIMILAPPTWLFTAGNQATIKMFHAKNEKEFISKEPWKLSPKYQPDGQLSSEKAKKMIQKAMKTGSNFFEWTHKRINGEEFSATVLLTRIELKDKRLLQATVRDITERKRIEEELNKHREHLEELVDERTKALKDSEKKYRIIAENTGDNITIATFDLKAEYLYVSPSIKHVLGYETKDLLGKSFFDFIHPDDKKVLLPLMKKYINLKIKELLRIKESSISKTIEFRFKNKAGDWRYMQSTVNIIGKNLLAVTRDITERKQAEEALRESKIQYHSIFDAATDSLLIFDLKGNLIEANSAACSMYDYPHNELIKLSGKDIVHPDYYHSFETFKRIVQPKGKFLVESVNIRRNGALFDVEVRGTSLIYKGKPHLLAIVHDITERKKAEEAVKISEEKLRNFINYSTLGIWCFKAEPPIDLTLPEDKFLDECFKATCVECNKTYAKMINAKPKDMLGLKLSDVMPDTEENRDYLRAFIHNGYKLSGGISHEIDKIGKEKYFSNSLVGTIKNGKLIEAWGTQTDITKRKRVEEDLKKNEQFLNSILESVQDGVSVLNPDMTIRHVNGIMNKWYKENLPLEGKKCYKVYHNADKPCDPCPTLRCLKSGKTEWNVVQGLQGSSVEWIELFSYPIKDPNSDKITGVVEFVRDITQSKRVKEKYISQLKNLINLGMNMRMELKLENMLQNICDLIVKSLGWQQVTLSIRDYEAGTSRPVAMSGYDKKIVENAFSKPPVSFNLLNKFLKDKYKISRSYYIDHTNWKMIKEYPAFIITPLKGPKPGGWDKRDFLLIPITGKKNILGFISPDNPVNGKRPTEEAIQALEIFADHAEVAIENAKLYKELKYSENRFQDIALNSGDWIWETDEKGRYTYSSPIVKQVLGYEYKEMLGKYFYDFFPPDERDKMKKAALNTFTKKKSFHNFINRNIHKDGREVILETSGIPIIAANGELIGYRGVDRNITERKKAEELQATIYNISNAVNTAKDLNEFFETLHTQLSKIINTTNFYLALYNKESDTISLPYHIDKKDRFTSFPAGRTLTSYVIRKGKSLLATEKDCDDLVKAGEIDLVGTPSKIWLGVPLKIENEVIGLVGVQNYTEETIYDEEDMKILEFVSDQTALAIDRMKKSEQINKDLEEKKVMLMEIHHRVKNNMQVISSMLKLQSRYIRDDHDLKLFNNSCHRVKSMSLIHEKLYQSKDLTSIDFADYAKSLTIHLFSSFGIDVNLIKFIINIKSILLNINMAIPCGLIVNELITNSLKYAFPDNRKGEISINLKSEPCIETPERKIYSLIVSDNGIGLPAGIDFENIDSFGLQLVNTLLHQLHANLEIDRKSGTSFKIVFKELQL